MAIHKDLTGAEAIHEIMYVQSADPGAVGANKFWLDTTSGATLEAGAILKQRDAPDTGWTTRADIKTALDLKAALASPTFTGTPAAPTAAPGTNTTQIATTAFVTAAVTAGSGGGLVLLDTQTASGSASLNFTTGIDATYDAYFLQAGDIVPATDNTDLWLRISTDAGSSYIATGYHYALRNYFADAFDGEVNSQNDTKIVLATSLGNGTSEHWNVNIWLNNPQGGNWKSLRFDGVGIIANPLVGGAHGMGFHGTTTAVDALQLIMASGNITSGWARLYGYAK